MPDLDPDDPTLKMFPFLLRPGVWVYLRLPPDLTTNDVDRLAKYLYVLVVDRELAQQGAPRW